MFEPLAMTKVIIAGSRDYMGAAIDAMHKRDAVHIADFVDEDEDFKIGKPYARVAQLSERAVSLRSIASYLRIKGKEDIPSKFSEGAIIDTIDEKTQRLDFEVTQVTDSISEIESHIKDINDKKRLLEPLKGFDLPLELYSGYRSLAVFVGTLKGSPTISDITSDYELETVPYGRGNAIALFCTSRIRRRRSKALAGAQLCNSSAPRNGGYPEGHTRRSRCKAHRG